MYDQLTFYTSIKPSLKWTLLMRASFLAGGGTLALIVCGITMQEHLLNAWGWLILALWLASLYWGMIPYRRLTRLETAPDQLTLTPNHLEFSKKGKALAVIPLVSVASIEHVDSPRVYGLGIKFIDPAPKQVVILGTPKMMAPYINQHGFNLFFPYFTQRTFNAIEEARGLTPQTGEYHEA